MDTWRFKTCALALALAILPGAVEIMENATHLMAEGHLAHAQADGDRHEPSGPEHGCTPTFHFCGCHASLALASFPTLPAISLRQAGIFDRLVSSPPTPGFRPSVDRPPRA
ncbi:MAG: hypothetical protein V3T72_21835 [Thermoanaerobaculia bacterium]